MSDKAFLEFVTDWDFSAIGHVAFRTARLAFVPKSAYSSSFKRLAICSGDNSCDASRRRLELLKANIHLTGNGSLMSVEQLSDFVTALRQIKVYLFPHLDCTFTRPNKK